MDNSYRIKLYPFKPSLYSPPYHLAFMILWPDYLSCMY